MKYYKLIDAITTAQGFYAPHLTESGVIKWESFQMLPGEKYDEFIDDPVFMNHMTENAHKKIDYTPERKAVLDACGARYKETKCVPCSGKRRLDVWFVEVVEE